MDYSTIQETCKTFNKGFDDLNSHTMIWGSKQPRLKKSINKLLSLDHSDHYPPGYGNTTTSNYITSQMLIDPKAIQQMLNKKDIYLTDKARQILTFWKETPGFWCFFAIKEILQDNFLTIVDLASGNEHLLYSPALISLQKSNTSRNKHYLCLMLPNGECLQTAGILRHYSLSIADLMFHCSLFEREADLQTVITDHYSDFFELDKISSMPKMVHGDFDYLYTWTEFHIEAFDIKRLGGTWTPKQVDSQISYSLQEPDASMMDVPDGELLESDFPIMGATLYRDDQTGAMALSTKFEVSYRIFADLLTRAYPNLTLLGEPDIAIPMVLCMHITRMGLTPPWDAYKKVEEALDDDDDQEKSQAVQALLQYYMETFNAGNVFDAEAYSKRSGMDLEEVQEVASNLEKVYAKNMPSYEVPFLDRPFEMGGWPVPPPKTRGSFHESLEKAMLFDYDDGQATQQLFTVLAGPVHAQTIDSDGLLEFIEGMFIDNFDMSIAHTLMNTFFWILFYKGKQPLFVRSYAIEMLKLFPYPITQVYPDSEAFIEAFSRFTKKTLCSQGICSLSSRPKGQEIAQGMYAIKGSNAFYSFVKPWDI